MDLDKNCEDP